MVHAKKIAIFTFMLSLAICAGLFEGDDCVLLSDPGGGGKCISIDKCDYAKHLLKVEKIQPQNCGFIKTIPLVCCPNLPEIFTPNISRSEEKCKMYHNKRNIKNGIALGEKARAREFPHMVVLGYGDKKTKMLWLCGGSLISERFVLTAAHCTKTLDSGDPKLVRVGDLNLNDNNDDADPQDILVDKVFVHPEYKPPSLYNDIALLKLKECASFGLYVRPACIHTQKNLVNGPMQAIGWGKTEFLGDASDSLMKVFLQIIEHKKWTEIYSNVTPRKLAKGIDDQTQICAGDPSGKDTCPGDSGGPLQYLRRGSSDTIDHFIVAGITSFGKGCGFENSAGVYTRVSSYRSWIESIVWPVN